MTTYRVFGTRYQDYYTVVDAKDEYEAITIANGLPSHEWNELPLDDDIEATDVYLNEDIDLQLNM